MRPLRVLQFITPAGFYGAERWILALANNLDADAVLCDLAVTREAADQDLTVAELYPREIGEVHYLDMSGRFDLRVVKQLCKVVRRRKIDVIHTHGYKSDILGLLAARWCGIRCVSTPHGFSGKVGFKLGAFIRIGTHMLRYFDRVAPLSEELMQDMQRFGVPAGKTTFIRNGVDLSEIDAALEDSKTRTMWSVGSLPDEPVRDDKLSDNTREQVIGFIGQMIPRKGIPDLLEVFDKLYRDDNALKLQLLGDGRQRPELETMAAGQASAGAIEFLGFRSDRLRLLSGFDLFVMTSSLEGIPRCMMEAMSVGVPVVAYDIPGVDKLVNHGETGLLAPFGNKEALVQCCRRVLGDSVLADKLRRNARELIERDYSAARMAEEYEQLFSELLGIERCSTSEQARIG